MSAGQNSAGFGNLVKAAFEYAPEYIEILVFRKADDIQSRLNVSSHRIDVT